MPAKGVFAAVVLSPDVLAMQRTHELAHELGAPDLAESKTFGRDVVSGTAPESTLTRATACARFLAKRAVAAVSLQKRPVDGYFSRCGHQKTEANTYTDARGDRCRTCRNERKRAGRAMLNHEAAA